MKIDMMLNRRGVYCRCFFLLFIFTCLINGYAQKNDPPETNKPTAIKYKALVIADIDSSIRNGGSVVTAPIHFGWKEWTFAALSIGATVSIFFMDSSIRAYTLSHKSPTRDRVILPWEYYGTGYTAFALGAGMYGVGLCFLHPWWQETGREVLTAVLISGIAGRVLKIGFGRFRPYTNNGANAFLPFKIRETNSSFPSGHTLTAFAVSSVLAKRISNPYVSCGLYGVALFTGTQRIYSDSHWSSDVVFGAILGTVIGRFVAKDDGDFQKGNKHDVKINPEFTQSSVGLTCTIDF
jgi:membrane-associated phospholipid phosphatase